LTILSLISAFIFIGLMVVFEGASVNLFYLVVGIILTSVMLILLGFIIVSRVNSINGYLLVIMIAFISLSFPPVLQLFGLLDNPITYLWPTQASFILFDGVFNAASLAIWEIAYGILYQVFWIGLLYYLARKSFYKYIVLKGG
jgi:fluoroquinolone transport system permease protein